MSAATLMPVELDEPIDLWSAQLGEGEQLGELLARVGTSETRGRRFMVLRLPDELSPSAAVELLARAARSVDELVIVAHERERVRWGALSAGDLRALAARPSERLRVVFEPSLEQALRGTLLRLRPADACWLVCAPEPGPSLHVLVHHALRQRGE